MFDRWLPSQLEFSGDVLSTLNDALSALERLGHPICWIPQPRTMGGLYMRQAEQLAKLRQQLADIAPPKKKKKVRK